MEAIQWILQKLYHLINKNYMALSREMEFHADQTADHVVGAEPLKNMLARMLIIDTTWTNITTFYGNKTDQGIQTDNIYHNYLFGLKLTANYYQIPLNNLQLPMVSPDSLRKFHTTDLVLEDQWASHPDTEQRIERLNSLRVTEKPDSGNPASVLFSHMEQRQREFTQKLSGSVEYSVAISMLGTSDFEQQFTEFYSENMFAPSSEPITTLGRPFSSRWKPKQKTNITLRPKNYFPMHR